MPNYANMMHNYSAQLHTDKSPQMTSVSVVGARGYSGLELCKLLLKHPFVQLKNCFATKDFRLSEDLFHPKAAQINCFSEQHLSQNLTDVVFLATPAEVSMKLAPQIIEAGKTVIDLSGAFRLKQNDYNKWYGHAHSATDYAQHSEYGLLPFCGPVQPSTQLISNPGCYATAISMALLPLLKHNLIQTDGLVIDAKSGTTGAGKKASENLLFSEVEGECLPYKVGRHQHLPEIVECLQALTGQKIDPHFTTHLLPVKRGITAAIYAVSKTQDIAEIANAYAKEFEGYPLVRHSREIGKYARLAEVVNTPFTHISYELIGNKLYLFSVIDNLLKGAASQAVENLNRLLDLPAGYSLTQEG